MALRDHVEGRESIGVAALSVVMWVGICWVFDLPWVMAAIVAVLLFLGGVLKSASTGSAADDTSTATDGPSGPDHRDEGHGKKSIYGPPD